MKFKSVLFSLLLIPCLLFGQNSLTGKAVYFSDGDTFHLLPANGEKVKVRVADIDCPERAQPFGLEAKEFVMNQLKDKEITINIKETDRYGRKVARVIYDGKDLSEELVKHGFAWHYKRYSNDPELAELEQLARKDKLNIWSKPKPVPPWDYRKNK